MDSNGFISDHGLMEVLFWDLVGWTEKNLKKLEDGWCPGRDLRQVSWKYKCRPLLLHQPAQ